MTEDQTLTEVTTASSPAWSAFSPPVRKSCSCTAIPRRARQRRSPRSITESGRTCRGRTSDTKPVAALSGGDEPASDRGDRTYHFAPTNLAREHLLAENVPARTSRYRQHRHRRLRGDRLVRDFPAPTLGTKSIRRPTIVVTAHRRENHHICVIYVKPCGRSSSSERAQLYWPVHPSPRVAPVAHEMLEGSRASSWSSRSIMPKWSRRSRLHVRVDGFGRSARRGAMPGKPVLVMREETERPEGSRPGRWSWWGTPKRIARRAASVDRCGSLCGNGAGRQPIRRRASPAPDRRWLAARLRGGSTRRRSWGTPAARRAEPMKTNPPGRERRAERSRRRRDRSAGGIVAAGRIGKPMLVPAGLMLGRALGGYSAVVLLCGR